jgi:hypothetical protein
VTASALLELPVQPRSSGPEREREGGSPTLDELVAEVWEALAAESAAPCPVCGGALIARYGAGPAPVAARCRDCGCELD